MKIKIIRISDITPTTGNFFDDIENFMNAKETGRTRKENTVDAVEVENEK